MSDLTIPKGTTWGIEWPMVDADDQAIDASDYDIRAQVRASRNSTDVLHEWSSTIGNAEGGDGYVRLLVDYAESEEWDWDSGYYDVLLTTPDDQRIKRDSGRVRVEVTVTRDDPA